MSKIDLCLRSDANAAYDAPLLCDRRSSWVSIKEEPYHKEHERDKYQYRKQVQEDGKGKEHDYQDKCRDYDI